MLGIYEKIEKDIKTTDFYTRESFLIDLLYIVSMFVLAGTVWIIAFYEIIGWIVLASVIVFIFIIWYIANFKILYEISHSMVADELQPFNSLQKIDIFKFKLVFVLMRKLKNTKPIISEIIKKYGIKTKDGLEEAIQHFRFKASMTREMRLDILAVLALATSITGYLLNNLDLPQHVVLAIFTVALTVIFIVYISILGLFKRFFVQYGKKAFYIRIENALSEMRALNSLTTRGRKAKSDSNIDVSTI